MSSIRRAAAVLLRAGVVLGGIGWLGLKIPPRRFRPPSDPTTDQGSATLPRDLPLPVARHFHQALGERFPVITDALVWGRAQYKIAGMWAPARFRTRYRAGRDFRREVEATWFGKSVLHGEDIYVNGEGAVTLHGILHSAQCGDRVSDGAAVALWAETVWTPSVFVTDPRILWEAVDDEHADLLIPTLDGPERLHFRFDPQTGWMDSLTALRYRDQEEKKAPWRVTYQEWKPFHGMQLPTRVTIAWEDERGPWSVWKVDGVAYNGNHL